GGGRAGGEDGAGRVGGGGRRFGVVVAAGDALDVLPGQAAAAAVGQPVGDAADVTGVELLLVGHDLVAGGDAGQRRQLADVDGQHAVVALQAHVERRDDVEGGGVGARGRGAGRGAGGGRRRRRRAGRAGGVR